MKSKRNMTVVIALTLVATVGLLHAGDVITTNVAPVVNGADLANFLYNANDKTWSDTPNHGQSFTTSSKGGILKAFAMQHNGSTTNNPSDKTWSVRVVAVNGTATTTLVLETGHVSSGNWSAGDWYIWTLDDPLALAPNTQYGIDVEMTASGPYQAGIPYMRYQNSDVFAGGARYTRADGDPTTISTGSADRTFHIDMDLPPPSGTVITIK